MSKQQQWIIVGALLFVAAGALVLGVVYQEEDRLASVNVVGNEPANGAVSGAAPSGGGIAQGTTTTAPPVGGGLIEGFLPQAGEASACREPVGVDLVPGFGAELTINGIDIAPEQMNVNLDGNGEITNVITASRSLGHYTFQPTDACPNGTYLRPVDNVLEVCVYRLSDPDRTCTLRTSNVFDAI
jgi:hypothetical protein